MKIVLIIVMLLFTLYMITFLRDIISGENNKKFMSSFIHSIIFSAFMICIFSFILNQLNRLSVITKHSIIVTYLVTHLILCVTSCFFIFTMLLAIKVFIDYTKSEFKNAIKPIESIKDDFNPIIKDKIFSLINFINRKFNPLYNVEIELNRAIKIILLLSYIIAGIILLSPITNYLKDEYSSQLGKNFNADYELYKQVFLVSIIPFTIGYITNKKGKDKNEIKKIRRFFGI